ncbi:MAG: hypothetical protein ACP5M4_15820 [Acidobacteriaceae bacterium]
MRLDIPQELPRRRENGDGPQAHTDERGARRTVPENPLQHRLKQPDDRKENPRQTRPRAPHRKKEPTQDVPRERRRPVTSDGSRRPARPATNIVGLELRPEEKQLLRETGRFRVVRTADLRESLYHGKSGALDNDLRYLRDKGLIETSRVNLRRDGRRRSIERVEVVTLTKEGRSLLIQDGDLPKDQKVYAGLVKPREVEHDSQIYRAYRKEAESIEGKGGTNLRVKLDYEIKADVQKAIYRERKADPARCMAEIKEQAARQFDLPFVGGGIQIPDARIEYDLPRDPDHDPNLDQDQGSRTGHEDIEVLTAAYHRGHLRSKAQAGFRNYASASDRATLTAKIEDDSHLMENILEL